jgi:hypothetical protein
MTVDRLVGWYQYVAKLALPPIKFMEFSNIELKTNLIQIIVSAVARVTVSVKEFSSNTNKSGDLDLPTIDTV